MTSQTNPRGADAPYREADMIAAELVADMADAHGAHLPMTTLACAYIALRSEIAPSGDLYGLVVQLRTQLAQCIGVLDGQDKTRPEVMVEESRAVMRSSYEAIKNRSAQPCVVVPKDEIEAEVEHAVTKFPTWPTDPLHALAVLGEEFGELTKAMLQLVYEPHKSSKADVRMEAIQTAAMALRLFRSLDTYEYRPGEQHSQSERPLP